MMIKIILAVAIIAAVIDAGVFMSDYFNKSFAVDALNSQIESGNQNLVQLAGKTKELNSEISKDTTNVNSVMTVIANESDKIPDGEISPNEIVKTLLKLGQQYNCSLIPMTTQDWSKVSTPDFDCQVLRMSLEIMGSEENITQIIKQLPQLYQTLVIESVALSKITGTPSPEKTEASNATQFTAQLNLAIYAK